MRWLQAERERFLYAVITKYGLDLDCWCCMLDLQTPKMISCMSNIIYNCYPSAIQLPFWPHDLELRNNWIVSWKGELEHLNQASDEINQLELQLDVSGLFVTDHQQTDCFLWQKHNCLCNYVIHYWNNQCVLFGVLFITSKQVFISIAGRQV